MTKKYNDNFNKQRRRVIESSPEYMRPGLIDLRRGKSLALAFQAIARAIQNPNENVIIVDHHPTRQANSFLMDTIIDLVKTNKLEGFSFTKTNAGCYVRFNLDPCLDLLEKKENV